MFYFKSSPLIIKKIKTTKKEIFLTFDDGPNQELTPLILDLLKEQQAKASFFVVGKLALQNPKIINRILSEGHGLFSHSTDHEYWHYFTEKSSTKKWLQQSVTELNQLSKLNTNIFRPPAGILTPPLLTAATELQIPLILWTHRFFDSVYPWTQKKAQKNLMKLKAGDIILLHDLQKESRHQDFLKTLRLYLEEVQKLGFTFSPINLNCEA